MTGTCIPETQAALEVSTPFETIVTSESAGFLVTWVFYVVYLFRCWQPARLFIRFTIFIQRFPINKFVVFTWSTIRLTCVTM